MPISLITATYNSAGTLGDCLASVAAQSHTAIQHILIDGESTDATQALLLARSGVGAVVVSEPDEGLYDALNKGLSRASGEVVGLLHGDDVFAGPEVLAMVSKAFADPAVQAVYGDLEYVAQDNPDKVIRYWRAGEFVPAKLRYGWMPPHPALFLRRSVYERFGGFDTTYRIAADYDFVLRVFSQLRPEAVVYIPQVFTRMRLGGASNRSLGNILRKSREDYRALKTNGVGGLGTLVFKNARKLPQFLRHSSC